MRSRWKPAILFFLTLGPCAAPAADSLPENVRMRLGSLRLRHYRASLAFAADSKTLLSVGQFDGTLCFWDVSTGKLLRQIRLDPKQPETVLTMYFTLSIDITPA